MFLTLSKKAKIVFIIIIRNYNCFKNESIEMEIPNVGIFVIKNYIAAV